MAKIAIIVEIDDCFDSGTILSLLEGLGNCSEPPDKISNVLISNTNINTGEIFINDVTNIYDFMLDSFNKKHHK